jgi:hypothetical protein
MGWLSRRLRRLDRLDIKTVLLWYLIALIVGVAWALSLR